MTWESFMDEMCGENISVEKKSARLASVSDDDVTADMLASCAQYLLNRAVPLDLGDAIDICGTGGSGGAKTFNVSTAAAFVLAAGGVKVVKHGNRAVSSRSGSTDVLAALGVPVCMTADDARKCFTWNNLCFVSAPAFHPALKNVAAARKSLGRPSFFNILGPLCNPARTKKQVIGVYHARFLPRIAGAAKILGKTDVMVAHSADGLDEFSVSAETEICFLKDGKISGGKFTPEILARPEGGTAKENAAVIRKVFEGAKGPAAEIVCLNAGAGFVVAGVEKSIPAGAARARDVIAEGLALKKLSGMRDVS